jgi:hypothetical protein
LHQRVRSSYSFGHPGGLSESYDRFSFSDCHPCSHVRMFKQVDQTKPYNSTMKRSSVLSINVCQRA